MSEYETELEALLEHIKNVVGDIEGVYNAKQTVYKLKLDVIDLLRVVMSNVDVTSIVVPPSIYSELPKIKEKEVGSVVIDQSGILVIRRKGKKDGEEGDIFFQEIREFPPETVIHLFNLIMPVLRQEIAGRRKIHEKHMEALQAIREGLSSVEKRRKL